MELFRQAGMLESLEMGDILRVRHMRRFVEGNTAGDDVRMGDGCLAEILREVKMRERGL